MELVGGSSYNFIIITILAKNILNHLIAIHLVVLHEVCLSAALGHVQDGVVLVAVGRYIGEGKLHRVIGPMRVVVVLSMNSTRWGLHRGDLACAVGDVAHAVKQSVHLTKNIHVENIRMERCVGDVFELASVAVFAGSSSLPVAAHLYFLGLCSLFSDQPQRALSWVDFLELSTTGSTL